MAKKGSLISTAIEAQGMLNVTVEGVGTIHVPVPELPEDIRNRALYHGLIQKISDAAAIPAKELPADPLAAAKAKFEAMTAVADRLSAGEWSKRSGDGSGPVVGLIFRAYYKWAVEMAAAAKKSAPAETAVRAQYDAMERKNQLALRNIPRVAEIMDELRAERTPAAGVDASALLAELGLA